MSASLLVAGAAVLAVLLVALGLALGLWWGERGRRIDAQTREIYGQPRARPARIIEQPMSPEQRAESVGYDPATIERGVESILAEAKKQGRRMSVDDARAQALAMLHPDAQLEGMLL